MTPSLWGAAALGLLGVPAMLATFLFGVSFGVGIATTRTPRLDAWFGRRGWGDAYGWVRTLWPVVTLWITVALSGSAAVAVPAALAWEVWHDVHHAVVAGSVGLALPVTFYALRTVSDWLRRE